VASPIIKAQIDRTHRRRHLFFYLRIYHLCEVGFTAKNFCGGKPGPYKGMSSFIFRNGSVVFNLYLIHRIHEHGDTLQKKETGCRGYGLSLAATATQSSMTTVFADLKYVHNLWAVVGEVTVTKLFRYVTSY
jgi:hypothetical protein